MKKVIYAFNIIFALSALLLSVSCEKEGLELNANTEQASTTEQASSAFKDFLRPIEELPARPQNADCLSLDRFNANGNYLQFSFDANFEEHNWDSHNEVASDLEVASDMNEITAVDLDISYLDQEFVAIPEPVIFRFNSYGNTTPNGIRGSALLRVDGFTVRGTVTDMFAQNSNSASVVLQISASNDPFMPVGSSYFFNVTDGGNGGANDSFDGNSLEAGNILVITEDDCGASELN